MYIEGGCIVRGVCCGGCILRGVGLGGGGQPDKKRRREERGLVFVVGVGEIPFPLFALLSIYFFQLFSLLEGACVRRR